MEASGLIWAIALGGTWLVVAIIGDMLKNGTDRPRVVPESRLNVQNFVLWFLAIGAVGCCCVASLSNNTFVSEAGIATAIVLGGAWAVLAIAFAAGMK
jgi:hypothetical protein